MKIIAIATMLIISTPAFAADPAPAQKPAPATKQSDASQDTRPTLDLYNMVHRLLDRNQDPTGNRVPLPPTPRSTGKSGPAIG